MLFHRSAQRRLLGRCPSTRSPRHPNAKANRGPRTATLSPEFLIRRIFLPWLNCPDTYMLERRIPKCRLGPLGLDTVLLASLPLAETFFPAIYSGASVGLTV